MICIGTGAGIGRQTILKSAMYHSGRQVEVKAQGKGNPEHPICKDDIWRMSSALRVLTVQQVSTSDRPPQFARNSASVSYTHLTLPTILLV
eukprot:6203569-Pleurochrysis_carterae.AAC.1